MHLGPIKITPHSNLKAVWHCDKCPATVKSRTAGRRCPYCSNRLVCMHNSLATVAPDAVKYRNYNGNEKAPERVLAGSDFRVEWKCPTCNTKWQAPIRSRVRSAAGCPTCNRFLSRSPLLLQPSLSSWLSGTLSATMLKTSFQKTPLVAARRRCIGSAHAVQEGSHTAGQQRQITASDVAMDVQFVLGNKPVSATPCSLYFH